MNLVNSFAVLLQELAVVMTAPSFENFVVLATGWAFAPRRTVTGNTLLASGVAGPAQMGIIPRFIGSSRKRTGRGMLWDWRSSGCSCAFCDDIVLVAIGRLPCPQTRA